MLDEAHSTLRFFAQLNVLDDLAHGKLGGNDAVDDLEMQIKAIPSTMADPHYTEAVRSLQLARAPGKLVSSSSLTCLANCTLIFLIIYK